MYTKPSIPVFNLKTFLLSAALTLLVGCSEDSNQGKDTRSADAHLNNSERYIKQGQYRPAILEIRNAVKKSPSAESIGALADVYLELGQYKSAQTLLEEQVVAYPALNYRLTQTYISLTKYFSAQQSFDAIDASSVEASEYQLLKAKILLGTGNADEGYALLQSIKNQYPNDLDIQLAHFITAYKLGTPEENEKNLLELVQQNPENPEALYTAARSRFLQKNYPEAEQLLMKALHQSTTPDVLTPLRSGILNLLSKTLTQMGRYADAVPFEKVLKDANPDASDVQAQLQEAITAIESGDIDKGATLLEQLHQDFPNMESAEALLGVISLEQGDADKASKLFQDSVDPETASPKLSAAAAIAELRLDRKGEALKILEKAASTNPENLHLQTLFGLTAITEEQYKGKGAQALEKAISLGTNELRAYSLLAAHYRQQGKPEKAKQTLKKASETFSSTPDQLALFGAYRHLKLNSEALAYAANLKQTQPQNEAGWLMTAAVNIKEGNTGNASKDLQKALALNNNSAYAWTFTGTNEMVQQNWAKAIPAFEKALRLNPSAPKLAQNLLAAQIKNSTDWTTIVNTFTAIPAEEQARLSHLSLLAVNAMSVGEIDIATNIVERIKASTASTAGQVRHFEIRLIDAEAKSYIKQNKISTAVKTLENGYKKFPDSPEVAILLGNLYLLQEDFNSAKKIHSDLVQKGHDVTATLFNADILIKQDKRDDAFTTLMAYWKTNATPSIGNAIYKVSLSLKQQLPEDFVAHWTKVDPGNYQPLLVQAMNAQQAGENRAIDLYESALKLNPTSIAALNNLAWLYQEDNKLFEADQLATRAVKLSPENAAVLDTAGYIKMKMDSAEAVELLERAVELAPNEKEIQQHLEQAQLRFN